MTYLAEWLAERRTRPPEDLLHRMVVEEPVGGEDLELPRDIAVAAATDELRRALEHPGRVRESALALLVADGWITYACEAALDEDDPVAALRSVTERIGCLL